VIAPPVGRRSGGAPGADVPDPETLHVRAVLLASEGREIPRAAVDLAVRIAKRSGAPVHVFTITRIWGTSLGFPNPGLMPSTGEWAQQRRVAEKAVARLERKGVQADARVVGTRAGAKRIVAEAARRECDAIVMAADPPRARVLANFMWSQEPHRVRRRADVPVFLVVESES
jgi:nucleotide-binding universal stress UspA family protein